MWWKIFVFATPYSYTASGMALYSYYRYAIHSEFVHGYLAMFIACFAMISVLHQVILVACLDQMIWVRILVCCAFELALASYLSIRRVGDPGVLR